jgi:hypothetical protein
MVEPGKQSPVSKAAVRLFVAAVVVIVVIVLWNSLGKQRQPETVTFYPSPYPMSAPSQATPSPYKPTPKPKPDKYGITIGTTADDVLAKRGKADQITQMGRDEQGLLVLWEYPEITYVMGHRESEGISAYRVIEIRPATH